MTKRTRFTISVENDVYEAFADLAHTSGVSLSRCIGDWLRDTAEAAQMTTIKLHEVRRSPQEAFDVFMRDCMVPEMIRLQPSFAKFEAASKVRRGLPLAGAATSGALRSGGAVQAAAEPSPRLVIRGGKSPKRGG